MNGVPDIFLSDLILKVNNTSSVSLFNDQVKTSVFGNNLNSALIKDIRNNSQKVIFAVFCEELNKYIRKKINFIISPNALNSINLIMNFTKNTYRNVMDNYAVGRTLFNRSNAYAFSYNMGVNDDIQLNTINKTAFFNDYYLGGSFPAGFILTYGKQKYIYMLIESRGMIVVNNIVLRYLFETSSDPMKFFDETISTLDIMIQKIYSKYSDEKLEEFKCSEDTDKIDKQRIINIMADVMDEFRGCCSRSKNSDEMFDALSTAIVNIVYNNDTYKSMLRSSIFKNKILEMKRKMETDTNSLFVKGFKFGAGMCSSLVAAGFSFHPDKALWSKEINMVPTMAIKEHQTYELRSDCGYNVKNILIHMGRLMDPRNGDPFYATGHHPNVCSDGKVCIGDDLRSDWNKFKSAVDLNPESLHEFIMKVITTLSVINYDSCYFDSDWSIVSKKIVDKTTIDEKINKAVDTSKASTRVRRVLD